MESTILEINHLFEQIMHLEDENLKVEMGDQLYLIYRKFVGSNLLHLHEEETQILPELQRLYTDEELRLVEDATYQAMTPKQMIHMLKVLFPHMNPIDQEAFLNEIEISQPQKFKEILPAFV